MSQRTLGRGNTLGQWRTMRDVEWETLKWIDWYNNRRLLAPIGYIPPAEASTPTSPTSTPSTKPPDN